MKKGMYSSLALLLMVACFSVTQTTRAEDEPVSVEQTINLQSGTWSREENALTVSLDEQTRFDGQPTLHVVHTGDKDWALASDARIPVKPGDVFTITITGLTKNMYVSAGVILRCGEEVLSWVYGGAEVERNAVMQNVESQFVIPHGADNIAFRVTGSGNGEAWVNNVRLTRTGSIPALDLDPITLENKFLLLEFISNDGRFNVTDKRTGKTFFQREGSGVLVSDAKRTKDANGQEQIEATMIETASMQGFSTLIQLEQESPEIVVRLSAPPEMKMTNRISWPNAFESRAGDRVFLPVNEGISFPVEEDADGANWTYSFGGHGICMSFFGQITDTIDPAQSDGYLGIIETPDDFTLDLFRLTNREDAKLLMFSPHWIGQKKLFGYDRVLRYCFADQGGYVALCKRYREYAKEQGLVVPFDEKIKRNPALADGLDCLIGAANIWYWERNKLEMAEELKKAGIDRILWSSGGSGQEIAALNQMDGVLTSVYDIYQDLMDPALIEQTAAKHAQGSWPQEAWPHDVNWSDADGSYRTGWTIEAADRTKPNIPCVVLCDRQAIPYAKNRISKELQEIPYRARFLDTTTASPWQECWSPDHPMTRTEGKFWKMKLLELIGKEFNLVCGSETGHEASVPYCDFFEGMMSLGPYRVPDSGRDMMRIWDEVPENLAKYQVGPEYRLPLWELIYHDCTVSYWYWGDYSNKLPAVWWKRDLFNALYGVPPMYMFSWHDWNTQKEKFVASYKIAEPVSRMTGRVEMTDHRILTPDRLVQQTTFANGCRVTVNFSDSPYACTDGQNVAPRGVRIEQ
ncbi:MAG: glycoside hydrolase [Planctomycetia bacterium]|nr:glycoside hydrolase [Planctomycetia bacterium]